MFIFKFFDKKDKLILAWVYFVTLIWVIINSAQWFLIGQMTDQFFKVQESGQTLSFQEAIGYALKLFAFMKKPSANHKKAVLEAAKTKDLQKLRDELLLWSAAEFPRHKVANLQDVADIFQNAAFNKELDKLREALYAETAKDWDNKTFIDVFCKMAGHAKKHKRTTDEPLPKLYK